MVKKTILPPAKGVAPIPTAKTPPERTFDSTKTHREYKLFSAKWTQLKTCLAGEEEIKAAGEKYLPYPVRVDDVDRATPEFESLYELYRQGAHFVEYTSEAVEDLISSAFRRPITLDPELPKVLDYLDLSDIAKEVVGGVGSYGRWFILADYPTVEITPSMENDGENRAYITMYEPLDVLDWTVTKRSGKAELTRVVLREIDELKEATEDVSIPTYLYRELYMNKGKFKIRIHRDGKDSVELIPIASGKAFTEIPGTFIGTTSNTAKVDKSPVIGISNSNLKHYQTWADLMNVQVYVGNPQLVLAGLAAGWNAQAKKNGVKVKMDASQILALEGDNSSASLLEIDTNSLVHFRTLEVLEQSMSEQGARIKAISKKAGVESAEALKIRSSASMSKLAAMVANTEEGMNKCLGWLGQYMGTEVTTEIEINKEFFTPEPDGSLLTAVSNAEAGGTAPRGTAITYLKQIELVDDRKTNEEYLKSMTLTTETTDKPDTTETSTEEE